MKEISTEDELALAGEVRELIATYRESEDLITIGAYVPGSNKRIDRAIDKIDAINKFFRQGINELCDFETSKKELAAILAAESTNNEEIQISAAATS